ncbi:5-oxoprolinase/urea amidolyase family protein [Microbacterium sp. gxy059]|uniref:5-oxoprolinase subunit B/C family protein n=1 Tax=Microbacterium sp. gxy059 TaxID=2957199 RepID=UPI003D96F672
MRAVRAAGDRALLAEEPSLDAVRRLHAALRARPLPGQRDVVAAARTVLVSFATPWHAARGRSALASLDPGERGAGADPRSVVVDVVYDGDDLGEVGRLTGLGPDSVVRAHTESEWHAAFGGFAPGFMYLAGGDATLAVPRRDAPRTSVPEGSVALAGGFSAVYPRSSPGGWRIIGRTSARMWDVAREEPALVRPGDVVRFRAVRELVSAAPAPLAAPLDPSSGLEVRETGPQALLQDQGRPGLADLGASASGAADPRAAREANSLVGNPAGAAVIESLLGGLAVRARGDRVVAVCGAPCAVEVEIADGGTRDEPFGAPFALRDAETVRIGAPVHGLRVVLAVRGGIDVPPVLGSRSTDTLGGVGPAPLRTGDVLPAGDGRRLDAVGAPAPEPEVPVRAPLRIVPGPRDDWFGPEELAQLTSASWVVGPQTDRVGARLLPDADDPAARPLRRREGELPSEGVVRGSLQVPPSGEPVLFGPDHPVTGGYPVIAVVVADDLSRAAQLRPGDRVRFALRDAPPAT